MNAPEQIDALATARAGGLASLYLSWKQSLATLPPLPADHLDRLALALPAPASARHLARFLSRESEPQSAVARFLEEVEASEEQLTDWLEAFAILARFLDNTLHRPSLSQAIGYLHCCEAVAHTGPRYATFAQTVETMLSLHGYAGEHPVSGQGS